MTALTKLQDFFKYLCYTDDEPEPCTCLSGGIFKQCPDCMVTFQIIKREYPNHADLLFGCYRYFALQRTKHSYDEAAYRLVNEASGDQLLALFKCSAGQYPNMHKNWLIKKVQIEVNEDKITLEHCGLFTSFINEHIDDYFDQYVDYQSLTKKLTAVLNL